MKLTQFAKCLLVLVVLVVINTDAPNLRAQGAELAPTPPSPLNNAYLTVSTITAADGKSLDEYSIHGPSTPPNGTEAQRQAVTLPEPNPAGGTNSLAVPAFAWSFGCSATSASMIAAYYDRNLYVNLYTGPTNGGVMPLDSSSWGTFTDSYGDSYAQCPLTASRQGLDGRSTRGSIDDYWVGYMKGIQDPYITNSWTQHTWGDAIGDYMNTSQSAYGNDDGSTVFYNWDYDPSPLTCYDMPYLHVTVDGTYGRKLFYEAKGYTVTDCYNQKTDNTVSDGFSFAQFKAEIDAGHPVLLNLAGHSIVGLGYDDSNNTVYIHDTWDYLTHSFTWGTSYAGMGLLSVSVVNLASPAFNKSAPANGATGVALNPTLSWGTRTGATAYAYCYDTTNDNACGTWTTTGTNTSVALSGLAYNTTYYWHVRSTVNGSPIYSNGSDTAFWNFTTNANPAFNKLAPVDGATGVALNPTLSWEASSGATAYAYCYDTTNDNACGTWKTAGTNTSVALSGLAYNTTYYWQVCAYAPGSMTYANSPTAYWTFTTIVGPSFNKTAPANGATGVALNPTLSWGASSGATAYAYCYDTTNDNACGVWHTVGTNTSVALSGLAYNTTYYWHVQSTVNGSPVYANGSATAFWSFTTVASPEFNKLAPVDGATGAGTSIVLSWETSGGANAYAVCYDTSNDNACTNWISTGLDTWTWMGDLPFDTTYYWHVRATVNGLTVYSNGSATAFWSFTTHSNPAFNKLAPMDGATGVALNPTLSWGASSGATAYAYCYDTTNDNACGTWKTAGTNTSVALSGLAYNTTYYWQVRASAPGSMTYANSPTAYWSFTTIKGPSFNKSAPANGATGVALNPTLSWGASSGATAYAYCYDTTNDNACGAWQTTGTNTSVALSGLAYNTTYYWHARATVNGLPVYSNGSSKAYWSFTTILGPAFYKSAPANGATGASLNPTLSWGASSGATAYAYCYDTTNDNACGAWQNAGTNTSVTLSGLAYSTTYYWHVRATAPGSLVYANGSSKAYWSFTTTLGPSFNKTAPANGATGVAINPTLSWEASSGATAYAYCYDTTNDNACGTWKTAGTNTSVALSGLAYNTTYYWHVRATAPGSMVYANGSSKAYWSFTTLPRPAFNKTAPANGATGVALNPTLSWGAISGATAYAYCYDTTNDNACGVWHTVGTNTSVALSGLAYNTTYYWHVRATVSGSLVFSNGSATAYWSFTTLSGPSLPSQPD